jgi:hypothetical protein
MNESGEQPGGCFFVCNGCRGEIPAADNDGPADRPFRCSSCRQRNLDLLRINHPKLFDTLKERTSNEVADSDLSDKPASSRKRPGGNQPPQQQSTS